MDDFQGDSRFVDDVVVQNVTNTIIKGVYQYSQFLIPSTRNQYTRFEVGCIYSVRTNRVPGFAKLEGIMYYEKKNECYCLFRLYHLPEDTSTGRQGWKNGEDELMCYDQIIRLRCKNIMLWVSPFKADGRGAKTYTRSQFEILTSDTKATRLVKLRRQINETELGSFSVYSSIRKLLQKVGAQTANDLTTVEASKGESSPKVILPEALNDHTYAKATEASVTNGDVLPSSSHAVQCSSKDVTTAPLPQANNQCSITSQLAMHPNKSQAAKTTNILPKLKKDVHLAMMKILTYDEYCYFRKNKKGLESGLILQESDAQQTHVLLEDAEKDCRLFYSNATFHDTAISTCDIFSNGTQKATANLPSKHVSLCLKTSKGRKRKLSDEHETLMPKIDDSKHFIEDDFQNVSATRFMAMNGVAILEDTTEYEPVSKRRIEMTESVVNDQPLSEYEKDNITEDLIQLMRGTYKKYLM